MVAFQCFHSTDVPRQNDSLSMAELTQTLDRSSANILIVDDHAAVRAGMRNLISSRAGWNICGEASNGEQAVSLALRLKPSVIVMDISMPGIDGLEATRRIREQLPAVEVLIVSQHDAEHVVCEAQRAGARGFVVKSHLSADLLPALEAAMRHSSRVSAPVSKVWQGAASSTRPTKEKPFIDPGPHDDLDLMSGGGEMGALMRSYDWSGSSFGPVSSWPQSLRTALRICLDSRFPIAIWWGPDLRLLYNDAWKPALGTSKHPQALGAPAAEVWSDVWDTIGPMLESVMRTGQAMSENDQLLLFDRDGYVEETYWTHSYSAIRLSTGEVGGVFSAVHEMTDRVLGARRLKTLREVADQVVQAKNDTDACTLAMQTIVRNPADCPFAMIFLRDGAGAVRTAASFDADRNAPVTVALLGGGNPWAVKKTLESGVTQVFTVIEPGSMPAAPYGDRCKEAISIPIHDGNRQPIGVVTIGISPYRKLDAAYRDFFESLAKNLSANIINARAYELERKLRIDAERLASIVASSDDAIVSKDLNGIIKSWNKSAERMFGYTAQEAIGKHITLIIPQDRRDEEADILARLRRGERVDHFQTVRVRKDGTRLDISLSISPIRDSTGRVIGASKVARDITAQRRVEHTLREHRERFELIAQASQIGFWFCDLPFDKLIWDNRVKEHFGLPPEADVTIEDFYARLHPEDRERTRQAINASIENDEPYDLEYRTVAPDGRVRWIRATGRTVYDVAGHPKSFDGLTLDITERKQAEERERKITADTVAATAKFRAVFEQTTVFAGIMTKEGVLVDANKLSLDKCGYTADEVLGRPFWETKWWRNSQESQEKIRAATPLVARGVPYRETLHYYWADGTERLVDFALYPILDEHNNVIFLHPTGVDITDQKRAEEHSRRLAETLEAEVQARTAELENRNLEVLRQSELLREFSRRMLQAQDEERRRIARELHDSAGQTLTVLGMNLAQLVQKAGRSAPELATAAELIQQSIQQLHREIRTTSYLLHPPLLDENGLASALEWYVQGLVERSEMDIKLSTSEDLGRLPRDMELAVFRLVQECLTNIHRHSGSKTASIRIWRDTDRLAVEVRDRGKGMSKEKLAEIQSQGSGVGIRGMRERLRQFDGNLHIDSDRSGTRVFVTIPFLKSAIPKEQSGSEPLQAAV